MNGIFLTSDSIGSEEIYAAHLYNPSSYMSFKKNSHQNSWNTSTMKDTVRVLQRKETKPYPGEEESHYIWRPKSRLHCPTSADVRTVNSESRGALPAESDTSERYCYSSLDQAVISSLRTCSTPQQLAAFSDATPCGPSLSDSYFLTKIFAPRKESQPFYSASAESSNESPVSQSDNSTSGNSSNGSHVNSSDNISPHYNLQLLPHKKIPSSLHNNGNGALAPFPVNQLAPPNGMHGHSYNQSHFPAMPVVASKHHFRDCYGRCYSFNMALSSSASCTDKSSVPHQDQSKVMRVISSVQSQGNCKLARSKLLEDFRNNLCPDIRLADIANHVAEFSEDQLGSRFIQTMMEKATPSERDLIFTEIFEMPFHFMTHMFGNYVIQKLLECGTDEQRTKLAKVIVGQALTLALDKYGCRVFQRILEYAPEDTNNVLVLIRELEGNVLKCVKDPYGNHVIQKCMEMKDLRSEIQFILNVIKEEVYTVAVHSSGCRVMKRILENYEAEQIDSILTELNSLTAKLVTDQYGNYVVQHLLRYGRNEDRRKVVSELKGKIIYLSQHKYASNVIETCIQHASKKERTHFIDEICNCKDKDLLMMMTDSFANYVMQKIIETSTASQRKALMYKVRPHVSTLQTSSNGKHILAKLEKFGLLRNTSQQPK